MLKDDEEKPLINECPCETPGWCDEYETQLTGRMFDICRGYNDAGEEVLSFDKRLAYKELWIRRRDAKRGLKPSLKKGKKKPAFRPPRRRHVPLPKLKVKKSVEDLVREAKEKTATEEIVKNQPGIMALTGHFALAVANHTKNNVKYVTKEKLEKRLIDCVNCDFLHKGRCLHRKCGCRIWVKAKWESEKCPIGKWKDEATEEPDKTSD